MKETSDLEASSLYIHLIDSFLDFPPHESLKFGYSHHLPLPFLSQSLWAEESAHPCCLTKLVVSPPPLHTSAGG